MRDMLDVVVVGAGPGGSVAAKRCAEYGLKTLLLEKRRLPRDKVCSGMIMSHMIQTLIEKEFGQIPEEILSHPKYLSGLVLHVIGMGSKKVEHKMPIALRKDLDYWMNRRAREAGAEIWDNAEVTEVIEAGENYIVNVKKDKIEQAVEAKFIIGADGATSAVRKSIFPNFRNQYSQTIQECYQGTLDLEKEYFHFFYFPEIGVAPSFDAHYKGDIFIIDMIAKIGDFKKLNLPYRVKNILSKEYGFDPNRQPLWIRSCLQPLMYKELTSGSFSPYKGNLLLVGEAGGLLMPLMAGDGIREAVWSGILAAISIIEGAKSGIKADRFYSNRLAQILKMLEKIYFWRMKIREQIIKGDKQILDVLEKLWQETLNISLEDISIPRIGIKEHS